MRRQVEFNVDNLVKMSVYYHDVERLSDERRAEIHNRRREHERWVVDLISEAQKQGMADPNVDPKILSRCIFATIIWPYQWFRPGRDKRADVAETLRALRAQRRDRQRQALAAQSFLEEAGRPAYHRPIVWW